MKGGVAAKLAWPRLNEYFIRFRLCSKLNFELDVFAPTLSKVPIHIRRRTADIHQPNNISVFENKKHRQTIQLNHPSDDWMDPLDDDKEDKEYYFAEPFERREKRSKEVLNKNRMIERDVNRLDFFNAMKSYWPSRNIIYDNIAYSARNVTKKYTEKETSRVKETKKNPQIQLEVKIAVCPHLDEEKIGDKSNRPSYNIPNDIPSNDDKAARLKLVRIVNGVPVMESAEAQSCGLVHGVTNKDVWGSYGLDIDRRTSLALDANTLNLSFQLHDSNIIAPFINKNPNHKQLKLNKSERIHKRNREEEKCEQRRKILPNQDLRSASLRIGTILVVVEIHAAPSSLPLPTLSKVCAST